MAGVLIVELLIIRRFRVQLAFIIAICAAYECIFAWPISVSGQNRFRNLTCRRSEGGPTLIAWTTPPPCKLKPQRQCSCYMPVDVVSDTHHQVGIHVQSHFRPTMRLTARHHVLMAT